MGINMDEPTQEGRAFEDASAVYDKSVKDHEPSNEWKKMAAMARGENFVEPEKPKDLKNFPINKHKKDENVIMQENWQCTCCHRNVAQLYADAELL